MALYTLKERYNSPSLNQTQMWNMLGRDAGLNSQQQQNFWDNPIGNAVSGFIGGWKKKGDSISNALHTTAAALGPGWVDNIRENTLREQREKADKERMQNIYSNAGYNSSDDFWNEKDAAEQELFKKYGYDIDNYWNQREKLYKPSDPGSEELAKLDASRENVKALMTDEERNRINRLDDIERQIREESRSQYDAATKAAKDWEDYRTNSYIGKKINQDQGKFLGDALTTLSTGADIAAMTTGLPMGVLANTAQGGIEGIANELSENGFQNFDWNRAGQNAAIGAASGLATAGLNKAMGNSMLKNKKLYGQEGAVLAPTNAFKTGANKVLNSSIGRGALSGAVGGAVGGGVGAAINGQDVGQAMLSGAGQGAVSGAVSGAAMGAINKIGNKIVDNGIERANERMKAGEEATRADNFYNKIREIQGAGDRWTKSGKNVRERWANTAKDSSIIQGTKALGDRISDAMSGTKKGFVANPFYQGDDTADANVGYIKKYQNQGMGIRKATDEAYKDLVRDHYDEDMGGYEGALRDAKAAGYPNETNYQKAQRFLQGGGMDIYPGDMFESLREVYGPDFKESTYKNKDGSWKVKNGEYYVETMYKNQIAQRMAKDMDAMDAGTYQNNNIPQNTQQNSPNESQAIKGRLSENTQSTYQNGLNNHINSLLAKAENGTISYDELATLQSYAPQILGSGDVRAAELAGISEDDWNAYNNGNERTILRKYGADVNNAHSNYEPLGDSDLRTRESTADWYKQSYANPDEFYRLHGDINDFDNTAFRNKVTGETAVGYDLRNNGVFDDLYNNSDFRNFGAGKGNHLAGANSLDEFKLYVTGDSADNLTNTLNEWTDWQPIEDWNDTRVNATTGTSGKKSIGDKFMDWMVKGGSKKGFVANPFYKEEAGGDYTDDINNMQINRNDMLDTSMESPETELYNQLTGNAERSMQSSTMPTTSSDPWDNLAREYGYGSYNDAIKAFAQANPNTPISAGAVTTWLDSNEGSYNPNATVATTTENPLEKVFETKTNKIQKQNKAQSIGKAIENAGESVSYSEVYDALDPKTAARAQETKAVQKLSSMGVKPRDYEEYAKTSNEVNRIASELAEKSNVKVIAPDLAVRLAPENIDVNLTDDAAKTYNNYIRQIVADGSNPDEYTAGYLLDKSRWLGEKAEKIRGANSDDIKQALRAAKWVTRDLVSEAMADKNITGEGTTDLIAQNLKNLGANEKVIDYYTAPGKDGKSPNIGELINRTSLFEQARDMGAQIGSEAMTRSASKYPASSVKQYLRSAGLDQLANVALKQIVAPITGGAMKIAGKGISAVGNAFSGTQANNTASNPQTEVYDLLNRQNTFNIMGRHQGEEAGESQQPESYIQQASAESGYVAPLGVTTSTYGTGTSTGASSLEDLANTGASTATTSTSLADTLSGNNAGGKYAGRFSNTGNSQVDLIGRAMELAMEADDAAAFGTLYSMYNSAIENLSSGNNLSAAQQTQIAKFDTAEDAINELESLYNQAGGGQGIITGNLRNLAGNWSLDSDARTYNQMAEGLVNQIAQAIGKTDSLNTEGEVKRALQLVPSLTDDAQTAENKLRTLREMLAQTKANYYGAYGVSY